jgi:uncharacterized repeat protein (TIGR01451 family)
LSGRAGGTLGAVRRTIGISLWISIAVLSSAARAADNQAIGDIAGDGAALADSNVVTISSTGEQLALVKRAFLADGTPVPGGSTLPHGSTVKFLIYINNRSAVEIRDVNVQDILPAGFVYQTGSLKVDNSVLQCTMPACLALEEATIFSVVNATAALTDGVDGDAASYTIGTTTVDAGRGPQNNAQVNLAAHRVWALLFTVSMP